jgi:hypothetical protein
MKSKLVGLMALVSPVLALSGGAASAVTFDWSSSGTQISQNIPVNPTGSGTFTATDDGSGQYTITAITGTFDGGTITSLAPLGTFGGNDNLLFYPASAQFDKFGVSFAVGVNEFNIAFITDYSLNNANPLEYVYDFQLVSPAVAGEGFIVDTFTASPETVTPLPAALPLFATGLGAFGLLGWRRKRKNVVAIAA